MIHAEPQSLSARLTARLLAAIAAAGGWLPFDRFMAMALYEPGLGYYASGQRLFGSMPASGSDFGSTCRAGFQSSERTSARAHWK